jgi:radical SAM protein with 4Fe4S-binding SPASM domain
VGFYRKEQITFLLTGDCDLSCRYCYMPKWRGPRDLLLDVSFARAGLHDFFSKSDSRTIRFFAPGEPTLAFERMAEIWDIAKSLAGERLRTELETNGHFGPLVAQWVETHVDYLWISCDGWPTLQDSQRPRKDGGPSSDLVLENVRRFARLANVQFGVRVTIEAPHLEQQSELIDFFHGFGVKYVAASPTYHSKANPGIVTPSLVRFAQHFVPAFLHARELGMLYLTLLTVNFDEEVDIYCQSSIPTPRLTPDGFVSCCDWAAFGSENLSNGSQQELIYGRFNPESQTITYDKEKIERLRRRCVSYLATTHCRECPAIRHCAGGCVGKMMAATDDLYRASSDWCEAIQYLLRHLPANQQLYEVLHP